MIVALFEGIALGLTLALLAGPAFITLVQTSIYRGLASGFQVAVGVSLSDMTLIALSYLGVVRFFGDLEQHYPIGFIGGAVLIAFGFFTIKRKYKLYEQSKIKVPYSPKNIFKYLFKGYFLNIFNPFLLLFWISIVGLVSTKYGIKSNELIMFFTGIMGTIFITDIIKCITAHRLRKLMNLKALTWLNRIVGILLMIFGIALIIRITLTLI